MVSQTKQFNITTVQKVDILISKNQMQKMFYQYIKNFVWED